MCLQCDKRNGNTFFADLAKAKEKELEPEKPKVEVSPQINTTPTKPGPEMVTR